MSKAKKLVSKKLTKKKTKKTVASKKTKKKITKIIKKTQEENILIKLLIVIVIAALALLSLVHLMSKATIKTKTWDSAYKNYPELLTNNTQNNKGFFANFLKENSIAASDENYKIFAEFKNYNNSKRAILFGEKINKKARGIFIMNNNENKITEFEYLEGKKYDYLDNIIWMDEDRLAYDKIIENEEGLIPERHMLGKTKQNGLPAFLDWSNYETTHGEMQIDIEENDNNELSNYFTQINDEIRTYNYNNYTLTIAPNINHWTIEEYNTLEKEYKGERMRMPLLGIVNDGELLLWADRCAGYGVRLMEDQAGYEEQQNCFAAEKEILKYFE